MNTYKLMTTILGDETVAYDVCRYLESRQTIPTVGELTKIKGIGEATANKVLACMELSATYMVGTSTTTFNDPDDIARRFCHLKYENQEPLLGMAVGVVLCHNHPSGNISPSPEDISITRVLASACRIMQIVLIDHVIVSRSGSYSLCRSEPEIFETTLNR